MIKSIEITNTINRFLTDTLNAICTENNVAFELHFSSNIKPTINKNLLRIYIDRRIIRENQDTLAIDVADFGRVRYTSEGLYSISFFTPISLSGSYAQMETVVQELKNKLRQAQLECVWLRFITASPFSVENESYRYELTFNYTFDEII